MSNKLAEIRARLQASENRNQNNSSSQDSAMYPFWNMDDSSTAVIRFINDANKDNPYFWVERSMIKLPFNGILGQDSKRVTVSVPCMEMWDEPCPILTEVRTWYKDESLKQMANTYWKKRNYLFQGFVRQSPFVEDVVPENPIRRFVITAQLFTIIKNAILDTEIEELPTDIERGLDFRITKTRKGEYADYSTSGWSRRESALTVSEMAALEKYGAYDLREFFPKKPSESELRVIREMFEASVDGEAYNPDKWANYFKPYGLKSSSAKSDDASSERKVVVPVQKTAIMPQSTLHDISEPDASEEIKISVREEKRVVEDPPFETASKKQEAPASGASRADEILAMIRNRQQKTA